jgi:hypothetical protein
VSPGTPTLPLTDRGMWRSLWPALPRTPAAPTISLPCGPCVRETLCGGELGPEIPRRHGGAKRVGAAARQEEPDRVDYAAAFEKGGLEGVTVRALQMAASLEEPYGSLLALLYRIATKRGRRMRSPIDNSTRARRTNPLRPWPTARR